MAMGTVFFLSSLIQTVTRSRHHKETLPDLLNNTNLMSEKEMSMRKEIIIAHADWNNPLKSGMRQESTLSHTFRTPQNQKPMNFRDGLTY
jgi:hypothetical protein